MPQYESGDDDMGDAYGAETPVTPPKEQAESVDEENAGEDTAIIPNKILSPDGDPIKSGDEIVLQVVENFGDESSVKYAPKKGSESEMSESEEPESVEAGELAALSEEGE